MGVSARLRCFAKRQLARVMVIDSYCERCGGPMQEYYAPDAIWKEVARLNNHVVETILCFNCFSEECQKTGLTRLWALVRLGELTPEQRRGFNKLLGEVT